VEEEGRKQNLKNDAKANTHYFLWVDQCPANSWTKDD